VTRGAQAPGRRNARKIQSGEGLAIRKENEMSQNIFSISLDVAISSLADQGEPTFSYDEKGRTDAVWPCGCEFIATDCHGGGILGACEEHADED
jgi:hypothetical protein